MKKQIFIASCMAMLTAVFLSVVIREDLITLLLIWAVGLFALAFALAGRLRWQTLAVWMIPAAIFIGVTCTTHIPLRMVFRVYRGEFDRVAELIEKGEPLAVPFWIGPFKIRMVGRQGDSGTPYVAINKDRSEIDGFVKHPQGQGFNLWSCVPLDESWSYIAED